MATLCDRAAAADRPGRSAPKRRRGVVPNDLRQRVDCATQDFRTRMAARFIAGQLDGLHPSALTADELSELREAWGRELVDRVLLLLAQVGYGARPVRRARAERAHGLRREARLRGVLGKLPRSLALRLPTTADTHRGGGSRNDGTDRWGPVRCSRTLRADHLGLIAATCGLWHARAGEGEAHVDCTAGEFVQLLTGRRRVGGKDVAWVHGLLADLETLELYADVKDKPGKSGPKPYRAAPNGFVTPRTGEPSGASAAHRIPSSPVERVERRIGDRWVPADEYAAALVDAGQGDAVDLLEVRGAERADCPGLATIRIHLAAWVREELAHPKRRPVFVNFDVWAHLRPQSRRTYAFVQGHGRDGYDDRVYFYLGPPTLFTLGLCGQRLDRARAIVSHDLTALWHADRRYHDGKGFRAQTHAATRIPAFSCDAARIPSAPTAKAMTTKSPAKRPGDLRGAVGRLRWHSIVAARGVAVDQLDPAHVRRVGQEEAKREAELVRVAIQRSLGEAAAAAGENGPLTPNRTAWRRQEGSADDDPAGG